MNHVYGTPDLAYEMRRNLLTTSVLGSDYVEKSDGDLMKKLRARITRTMARK